MVMLLRGMGAKTDREVCWIKSDLFLKDII